MGNRMICQGVKPLKNVVKGKIRLTLFSFTIKAIIIITL